MLQLPRALPDAPKAETARPTVVAAGSKRHHGACRPSRSDAIQCTLGSAVSRLSPSPCSTSGPCRAECGPRGDRARDVAEAVDTYSTQLSEYRRLQGELASWVATFKDQYHRQPTLEDVEAAQSPQLTQMYKEYAVLRQKVLAETRSIRSKLVEARQGARDSHWGSTEEARSSGRHTKAHDRRTSRGINGAGSERLGHAREYHLAAEGASTAGLGDDGPSVSSRGPISQKPLHLLRQASKHVKDAMLRAAQYRSRRLEAAEVAASTHDQPDVGCLDGIAVNCA
eukprot:evm.model.scf_112.3 EVM.evm.TU.scf_112.3   scf_112:14853-18844(+)